MQPRIIAHGGAGSKDTPEQHQTILEEAVQQGYNQLQEGSSATDAVEIVVNRLEHSPQFNAGRGAKLQLDGVPRLEAAIMDSRKQAGAVTGLEQIIEAISVARLVKEQTHHTMLGNGFANRFAQQHGFDLHDLTTEDSINAWQETRDRIDGLSFEEQIDRLQDMDQSGTVGCVAIDQNGNLAAATSTGGRSPQLAGRIGDTPLIGCGTYCNHRAAVSATGIGEAIIRTTLARRCCELIEDGSSPDEAASDAIQFLEEETGRHAGVIVVDNTGSIACSHNAAEMRTASRGPKD